jgi:16S rRNA (cytidine1402-2'-O)-methyltransferase
MTSSGTLYVVATPIGNREDLSPRALRVLAEVNLVACEDTRRTAPLLRARGVKTPLTSFFEHNERVKLPRVLDALRSGRDVALVSDAGTPGISDPGYRLVRAARDAGLPVIPVPGPSAAIAALCVSGLPTDRFLFVGFLPKRAEARRRALEELSDVKATLIFHESPVRAVACLAQMREVFGEREAFLCREATKLHEEYLRSTLGDLRKSLLGRADVKGEIVLVVEGRRAKAAQPQAEPPEVLYARLRSCGRTRREAVKQAARALGLPAREVYARVLAWEAEGER